jgi:hypothetical protein
MKFKPFSSSFMLLILLQQGCALDGSLTHAQHLERKQAIEQRYAEAKEAYKQKMAPIAHYIVTVCAPMDDKHYIECINGKRGAIKALSIYPENAATREQRITLEKRLIEKRIDRKQFRAELEALKDRYNAARLEQDISAGVYSGQY